MCGAVTSLPQYAFMAYTQRQLCFDYSSSIICFSVVSAGLKSFIRYD